MDYQIFQLDEHSWMIQEGQGTSAVYMYLLEGEKTAALIDTGMGMIPLGGITQSLTDKPIVGILTHGHFDHIGGSAFFTHVYLQKNEKVSVRNNRSGSSRGKEGNLFYGGRRCF